MSNLRVFTSNRLETLAEALANLLRNPLASPLDQEIIVVQSKGMERWVSMQLAERHGVCANCRFPFPNAFMNEVFRAILQDLPAPSLFDPDVMTWRVMKAIPVVIEEPAFRAIRTYLESGRSDLKRFQLSQRIADVFDQYLLFRPEMVLQWEKGKAAHWQSLLWRKLAEGHESDHRAALGARFFAAVERQAQPAPGVPERVSVFGISALPRFHVQFLASLARVIQVDLFLMNPCKEYWGDILSPSETRKGALSQERPAQEHLHMEKGNSLLASMGALGRDFFDMILEFQATEFSWCEAPGEGTLLNAIQTDILNLHERREKRVISEDDLSLQIHSCHSPMREVEVLQDQLLRMFEETPDLLPKDILVMMPDIERYAPYIQAVFDAPKEGGERIPFTIADRSIRKEGGVGETFLNILDLEGSRFGVNQVLNILESSPVRGKFGFSDEDLERVRRWVSETRIRWGVDEAHKAELGLPAFPQNTWRAGLERVLLGFAMPGHDEKMFSGILPYDPIEGGETRVLGSFVDFADKLFGVAASLGQPRSLEAWKQTLGELLDGFFEPEEETEREIQELRRMLENLTQAGTDALFDERVHLRIVRSYLAERLDKTGFGFGFMTGGVTFCAMLPMRSIPFRTICLLGMDGEAYPRQSKPLGFDFMARYRRKGDRSRRNDDRYLFLEAVLSAREKLYISYVGQSIEDNSLIPPSVLVSELMDYVEQGFETPESDIRDHLHTRHRLQSFSPEYFKGNPKLFTYSEENRDVAGILLSGRTETGRFLTAGLSEPDESWRRVDLNGLCSFFSNPAKFLLNRRLGLYLEQAPAIAEEREPFDVQALERYSLEDKMLRRLLRGESLKEEFLFAVASGALPHGTVGQCIYEKLSPGVARFYRELLPMMGEHAREPMSFQLDLGSFSLAGQLDRVFMDRMIRYRYARMKGKDLIAGWIHHLVLNCVGTEGFPRHTVLAGLSGKSGADREGLFYECTPVDEGKVILEGLLERYWEGLKRPLHFFPESSWKYAELALLREKSREAALDQARKTWEGTEWGRGEMEDPYWELCFRGNDPTDASFEEIALEIFEPIFESLKGKSE